jgi:hypothetical protein
MTRATASATNPHTVAVRAASSGARSRAVDGDVVWPPLCVMVPLTDATRRRDVRAGVLRERCALDSQ